MPGISVSILASSSTADVCAAIATAAAAFFAAWAAYEARRGVRVALQTAEATLVTGFLDGYFAPEMAQHLRTLRHWRDAHGDEFEKKWISALTTPTSSLHAEAQRVDDARRHVGSYFYKAGELRRSCAISDRALRAITYTAGINLYFDVVGELEQALGGKARSEIVQLLREKVGRYIEGANPPVPPR